MVHTTLTIKLPKKLRDEAKKTADTLGVPLTTAVNAMLKQFVREKELVLSAKVPNAETRRALKEAREGKNLTSYDSVDDAFEAILGKNWRSS